MDAHTVSFLGIVVIKKEKLSIFILIFQVTLICFSADTCASTCSKGHYDENNPFFPYRTLDQRHQY